MARSPLKFVRPAEVDAWAALGWIELPCPYEADHPTFARLMRWGGNDEPRYAEPPALQPRRPFVRGRTTYERAA